NSTIVTVRDGKPVQVGDQACKYACVQGATSFNGVRQCSCTPGSGNSHIPVISPETAYMAYCQYRYYARRLVDDYFSRFFETALVVFDRNGINTCRKFMTGRCCSETRPANCVGKAARTAGGY